MLDARDSWLDEGGRLLYVGGNGFYWVTAVAEDEPDVIEIRRYGGTGTWQGEPGEDRLALAGERGGLWRMSGRPPQARLGVGFCGQGFDRGAALSKTDAANDPRWSWIFAGVDDAVFGDGPSLVLGHGAAGFEIDRIDRAGGTPEHTAVLASADGFTRLPDRHGARDGHRPLAWRFRSAIRAPRRYDDHTRAEGRRGVHHRLDPLFRPRYPSKIAQADTSRLLANVIDGFLADVIPAVEGTGTAFRQHDGKADVLVVDYVDELVPVLARMAVKRRAGYRALGYQIE